MRTPFDETSRLFIHRHLNHILVLFRSTCSLSKQKLPYYMQLLSQNIPKFDSNICMANSHFFFGKNWIQVKRRDHYKLKQERVIKPKYLSPLTRSSPQENAIRRSSWRSPPAPCSLDIPSCLAPPAFDFALQISYLFCRACDVDCVSACDVLPSTPTSVQASSSPTSRSTSRRSERFRWTSRRRCFDVSTLSTRTWRSSCLLQRRCH